jgi:(hydroxyamino)benzene mutase
MSDINSELAISGVVLFLLGLLNGFAIPFGRSPRLGLSAHLTAVQSGTFLIAMSAIWPHIKFSVGLAQVLSTALWSSLYLLWLALFFAGILGAGRGLPIAGGGIEAKPFQQRAVSAILMTGTLSATVVIGIIAAVLVGHG